MKMLAAIEKRLPRRLTSRIILGVVGIVVGAGMVTTLAINQILANSLRSQLIRNGLFLTQSLAENLANHLVEGNLASIQLALNNLKDSNPDIVYAFAYGPATPIVHTFSDGFPADLLTIDQISWQRSGGVLLLHAENGLIWDFAFYPLDGVPAVLHIGVSEQRILSEQWEITRIVILLTVLGCLLAALMTFGITRLAMLPLVELTQRVRHLGKGNYDQRITVTLGDEIGELGQAFNTMADNIQHAIERLKKSERGYRALLTAAGEVGEGIALIGEKGDKEGELLYVNETFARILGYNPADLIGVNISAVLHPNELQETQKFWLSLQDAAPHTETKELKVLDRQGNPHILETSSTIVEYEEQRAIAWFARDITQRKMQEAELRLRNRELKALNTLAFALNQPYQKDFLAYVLHETLQALELSQGWITVIEEDTRSEVVASEGIDADTRNLLEDIYRNLFYPYEPQQGIRKPVGLDNLCEIFEKKDTPFGNLTVLKPKIMAAKQDWQEGYKNPAITFPSLENTRPADNLFVSVPLGSPQKPLGFLWVAFPSDSNIEYQIGLLSTIAHQIGIVLENVRLWEELQEKERLRAELLHKALQAQEDERYRIARELHDETGQSLNALVFGLKALETSLSTDVEQAKALVTRLKAAVADTIRELQTIIYDLRPTLLDDLGLIPAVRWYAETRLETLGIEVVWQVDELSTRFPSQVETTLFRIAQEAMTNISKYAQAREVRIELREQREKNRVLLSICDDGIGFDVDQVFKEPVSLNQGLGLIGMRERAELLGGTLEWRSAPGQGTCIVAKIPLPQRKGEQDG